MGELTPEQRQKIYLEENSRFEAQQQLQAEAKKKRGGIGRFFLWMFLVFFGLIVLGSLVGSLQEQKDQAEWSKLTPAQRHAKTLENCTDYLASIRLKTDLELNRKSAG